jgi:hypothetical protein
MRAHRDDPFAAPVRLTELNDTVIDVSPFISSDNLTLYFHQFPRIVVTHRPTRDASFLLIGPAAKLAPLHANDPPVVT